MKQPRPINTAGVICFYSAVKINFLSKAVMVYGVPIPNPTCSNQCPLRLIQGILAVGNDAGIYFSTRDNGVRAMNPDGTERWLYTAPAGNFGDFSAPVIASNGYVYAVRRNYDTYLNEIHVIDPSGRLERTIPDAGGLELILTASGNIISIGSGVTGNKITSHTSLGVLNWTSNRVGRGVVLDVDGTLYLPDDNEGITAIVTPEKGIMPNAWAMYTRDPQRSNSRFNYVPADTIAPVLAVTEPGDNLATSDNQTMTLSGTATDQEDGDISQLITWRSNIDGELGAGASVEVLLSAGFHTITARVIDSSGETVAQTVNISVVRAVQPFGHAVVPTKVPDTTDKRYLLPDRATSAPPAIALPDVILPLATTARR